MSGFDQSRRASTPVSTSGSLFGSNASSAGLPDPVEKAPVPPIFRPIDLPSIDTHEDHTRELQKKVSHLTRTMHHNLQYVLQRGSNLTDLEARVGSLELGSKSFQRVVTQVDKNLWWQENRFKMTAIWSVVIFLIILSVYIYLKKLIFFF